MQRFRNGIARFGLWLAVLTVALGVLGAQRAGADSPPSLSANPNPVQIAPNGTGTTVLSWYAGASGLFPRLTTAIDSGPEGAPAPLSGTSGTITMSGLVLGRPEVPREL